MNEQEQARNLERFEYRHGMLERGMKRTSLPKIVRSGSKIPESVRQSVAD